MEASSLRPPSLLPPSPPQSSPPISPHDGPRLPRPAGCRAPGPGGLGLGGELARGGAMAGARGSAVRPRGGGPGRGRGPGEGGEEEAPRLGGEQPGISRAAGEGAGPRRPRAAAWRVDLGRLLRMWAAIKAAQTGAGGAAMLEEAGRAPWDPPGWLLDEARLAAPLANWERPNLIELALPGVRPNSLARVGPQQLEDREISALLLPPPSPRARKGLRDGKTKSEGRKLMKRTKSTVVRVEKLVRPARGVGRTAEQGGGVQTPGASAALTLGESLSLGPVGFGGRSPPSLPPRCSSGRVPEASEGYCCPPARSYSLPCPICSQEEDLLFDYGDASRSFVAGSSPEEVTEGLGMPGLGPSSPLDLVQGESEGFNPGCGAVSSSAAATPVLLNKLPVERGALVEGPSEAQYLDARYLDARCDSAHRLLDSTVALLLPARSSLPALLTPRGRPPGTHRPGVVCPEDLRS